MKNNNKTKQRLKTFYVVIYFEKNDTVYYQARIRIKNKKKEEEEEKQREETIDFFFFWMHKPDSKMEFAKVSIPVQVISSLTILLQENLH